jgi:Zn-dependent protease with chaperone function
MTPEPRGELPPQTDHEAQARIHERHQALAVGALALPNLFVRSLATLGLLYGALGLVLIALVQIGVLPSAGVAVAIGCVAILLQYLLGPLFMDLSLRWLYAMSWVGPDELPEHLRAFVESVCGAERMRFPWFGIIDDGAPAAFTYGHRPNNARVVISRGLIELLTPEELEAVVAHELGHARNWDMALMTLANLVPLLLYYLYDVSLRVRGNEKGKDYGVAVAVGAYVLYIISQYLVLWFSRTREYFADRFSAEATGNPNALSMALVKIAYGLASRGGSPDAAGDEAQKKAAADRARRVDALGALNIFDRRAAVGLVMSSATKADGRVAPDAERIKGAMQWDLWNPWATYYEINSTHPLTAKRMLALSDQAAALGQTPAIVFDRAKPESYWDEFLVDLALLWAPTVCFVGGLVLSLVQFATTGSARSFLWLGAGLMLAGLWALVKCWFAYRSDVFEHLTVAALLHRVKVSAVRPVPVTLTGRIIGKGVPGLVWSEDFVVQDNTGLIFLDYRQPLRIWEWLFGLFRAGQYQGKDVRVTGWYRRSPVPYVEVKLIEVIDGSLPSRRTYSYYAQYVFAGVVAVLGLIVTALVLMKA